MFYIFGSHLAQARSTDLLSWDSPFDVEYQNMDNNIIYGNTRENLAETFQWAGYDDADSAGGFALWAPDVIWNPNYVWADGSVGAYMIYYSASSTWRRSAIGFAVAPTIEGPYAYGGTIIYSGFTYLDATDGSDRNTNWAATNIPGLIESGVINEFSENWAMNSFTYNNDYAPNAIDPTLFYDSDENLWMVYGSWSGGIFLLEIDEATGVPLIPRRG